MQVIRGGSYSPKSSGPGRYSKAEMQRDLAREAAIERQLSKYLHLICEHYSTLETDLFYSHLRPRKGVTWCEVCHKWVALKKPLPPPIYPDDPSLLF